MRKPNRSCRALTAVALTLLLASVAIAAPATGSPSSKEGPSSPVDLNSASTEQLTEIPGIGKVMAQRIVEWRDQHGPFQRVEDLMKVKGIGEKSFQKLRPFVKVSSSKAG
jgi:competence protein ComEA